MMKEWVLWLLGAVLLLGSSTHQLVVADENSVGSELVEGMDVSGDVQLVNLILQKRSLRQASEVIQEDGNAFTSDEIENQAENEEDDSEDEEEDDSSLLDVKHAVLDSLHASTTRRNLWSIEEPQKEKCCRKAFDLCERPPWMNSKQFYNAKPRLLKRANRQCGKLHLYGKKPGEKAICSFYSGHPASCAMTPNTEDDITRYEMQMQRCCSVSAPLCNQEDAANETLVYLAKKECFFFAARTPEEMCAVSTSDFCKGKGSLP